MKVTYQQSIKYKALKRIQALKSNAILREDVADLGTPRQVSRALKNLVSEKKIAKLGYGIYGKLSTSRYSPEPYLRGGFLPVVREALDKLDVNWEPSKDESDYNERRTTQIPVNPTTKLRTRFRRKLSYCGMEFRRD